MYEEKTPEGTPPRGKEVYPSINPQHPLPFRAPPSAGRGRKKTRLSFGKSARKPFLSPERKGFLAFSLSFYSQYPLSVDTVHFRSWIFWPAKKWECIKKNGAAMRRFSPGYPQLSTDFSTKEVVLWKKCLFVLFSQYFIHRFIQFSFTDGNSFFILGPAKVVEMRTGNHRLHAPDAGKQHAAA